MHISALRSAVVALCLGAAASVAAAETQDPPPLLDTIELWLVANFGLTPAAEAPDLATVPASRLVEIRYGAASQVSPGEVVAAYDEASRIIYFTEGWTGRTPAQLSVLVHEMVHHLQGSANMRFACPAEREVLAYQAQDAWLQLFGMDLESTFGIDPAMLLVATVCTH
ncbi:DUF6647 family protein [Chelativorans xinjiangense]|uniref:DUF6647 family protein n=1 Tax=Chelativorans xinjiangense TaxID=2681485 RepID=UPI001FE80748|nr:DUF6647 family protein [Chelativorans xinjiangense]